MLSFLGGNHKTNDSEKSEEKDFKILQVLGRDYMGIILVDAVQKSYEIYRSFSDEVYIISDFHDEELRYPQMLEKYIANVVYVEDRYAAESELSLENIAKELHSEDSFAVTLRELTPNGVIRYVRHEIKAIDIGDTSRFLLAAKNVDGEIKQNLMRQEQLRTAYLAAEKASRAKNEFLHNMSHDIRTPLNAIVGYTTVAANQTEDDVSIGQCLEKIEAASKHLLHIVDEILNLGDIENGNVQLEESTGTMEESVSQVLNSTDQMVRDKQITLVVNNNDKSKLPLLFDMQHFNRVLINLISNAVKFSDDGSEINLSIDSSEGSTADKVHYTLAVQDHGIGMSEEFIGKMFEPFERERTSTKSKKNGVGIGLTIAKNIIDAMGGSIHAVSAVGEGSTFTIEIELKLAPQKETENKKSDNSNEENVIAGKRVLVVDDSKVNRDIAMAILKSFKAETDSATDGDVAVDKFSESEVGFYDLILMDIQMPKMEGHEAAKLIREMNRDDARTIPIVALTADVFDDTRKRCAEVGMNGFLAKPVNMKALHDELINQFTQN